MPLALLALCGRCISPPPSLASALALQPHLSKCFDSIKSLDFVPGAPKHTAGAAGGDLLDSDDPAAQRVPLLMQAMNSSDGEKVPWPSAVAADGNVEDWLGDVEGMMRSSLLTHTKHALSAYPSTPEAAIDRRSWLFGRPAQCVIVIDQVMWTAGCTEAISRVASGEDRDALVSVASSRPLMLIWHESLRFILLARFVCAAGPLPGVQQAADLCDGGSRAWRPYARATNAAGRHCRH